MGEAAELYRGAWPDGQTVGRHFSVTASLPRLMEMLESLNVRVTYFVEGWNTGVYSGAIQALRLRGHEIACHGWQHEPWSTLAPDAERETLDRSLNGFEKLSLRMSGFRPPGGVLTDSTVSILNQRGFAYCSPAGQDAAVDDSIVYLPFDWQGIDAYYYSDGFAGLRAAKGDQQPTMSPAEFADRAESIIEDRVQSGGYTALLFHPFLEIREDRIEAMQQIINRVMRDDRIWCAPGYEIASWIARRRSSFGDDPKLDTTSWSR